MNPIEKVGAELIKLGGWVKHNFFKKTDYITVSRGAVDAGLPVITNASGVLDSTLTGGGGGGTSDHALLTHLAYADAAHTGFAGTGVANTFTRQQSIQVSIDDALLDTELVVDGAFPNLTNWTDDASGWVVSGGLTHTPGAFGLLTQVITTPFDGVYVLEFRVTGLTTGYVEIYDSSNLDKTATVNGTYKAIGYAVGGADTITISCDDTFDGTVTLCSVKPVIGGFPAHMLFFDPDGGGGIEFRFFNGSIYAGVDSGKYSQSSRNLGIGNSALDSIVDQNDNLAFGDHAGSGAFCNGGLFLGTYAGVSETVDNKLHIGSNGDIISGTMDFGNPATQTLEFHTVQTDFAGVITVNGSDTLDFGGYNAGAPGATGWVKIIIGGVTYKLLAST